MTHDKIWLHLRDIYCESRSVAFWSLGISDYHLFSSICLPLGCYSLFTVHGFGSAITLGKEKSFEQRSERHCWRTVGTKDKGRVHFLGRLSV